MIYSGRDTGRVLLIRESRGVIMGEAYFKPWLGDNYENTKVLILSESAYSWPDDNGKIIDPSRSHPKKSLLWAIDQSPRRGYFSSMSRALCGTKSPTRDQIKRAWDNNAYTIYIQRTVGQGARQRPSSSQWKDAGQHFLRLIEEIRPLKVIVTGLDMWNHHMPPTFAERDDRLQAYKLSDGNLVWCLAIPHPSNSRQGFNWEEIGKRIRLFLSAKLPLR